MSNTACLPASFSSTPWPTSKLMAEPEAPERMRKKEPVSSCIDIGLGVGGRRDMRRIGRRKHIDPVTRLFGAQLRRRLLRRVCIGGRREIVIVDRRRRLGRGRVELRRRLEDAGLDGEIEADAGSGEQRHAEEDRGQRQAAAPYPPFVAVGRHFRRGLGRRESGHIDRRRTGQRGVGHDVGNDRQDARARRVGCVGCTGPSTTIAGDGPAASRRGIDRRRFGGAWRLARRLASAQRLASARRLRLRGDIGNRRQEFGFDLGDLGLHRLAALDGDFHRHVRIGLEDAVQRGEGRAVDPLAKRPVLGIAFLEGVADRFFDRVQANSLCHVRSHCHDR